MAKVLRAVRILLAVMTALICLLLCWQAIDIYREGNSPENFSAPGVRIQPVYSREIVAERLSAISPALIAYGAAVLAGLILHLFKNEKETPSVFRESEDSRRRLRQRAAATPVSPLFRILLYAAAIVLVVLGVMNGGLRDVLVKAINICTECIGLG